MDYVYKAIPIISEKLFKELQGAQAAGKDCMGIIRKELPRAEAYWTVFSCQGKIYNLKTSSGDIESPGIEEALTYTLSLHENPIVTELPIRDVPVPTIKGVSERLFLRTLAIAMHGGNSHVSNKALPDYPQEELTDEIPF